MNGAKLKAFGFAKRSFAIFLTLMLIITNASATEYP
jgi:hypothetical protein